MKRLLFVCLAAVVCIGLASCQTPSSGLTVESFPHSRITVNSKMVGGKMSVVELNAAKRNGLLQAQVTVQNTTQKDIPFEYRYRWMEKSGMEIANVGSTWVPISISAKEKAMLQALASNHEAEDYILDIRFSLSSTRW